MPTARKDVADYINDNALKAAKFVVNSFDCKPEDTPHQTQLHAAVTILKKVIPDLKAIDLSAQIKAEIGKVMIDLADD